MGNIFIKRLFDEALWLTEQKMCPCGRKLSGEASIKRPYSALALNPEHPQLFTADLR